MCSCVLNRQEVVAIETQIVHLVYDNVTHEDMTAL